MGKDLSDPLISTDDLSVASVKISKTKPRQSDIPVLAVEVCNAVRYVVAGVGQ